MDNITHSLIGITVAHWAGKKAAHLENEAESKSRNRLWIWASIAGNNFPDLDVIYVSVTPGVLGRLLHHRGHTHTLIGIVPQLLLIFLVFWFLRRPLGFSNLSRSNWKNAVVLGALGLFLHILADSFNSYGVHPFFPLWNGWIYGDSVFIIEPILWAILAPSILISSRSQAGKIPSILFVALLGYGWFMGLVYWPSIIAALILYGILYCKMRMNSSLAARTAIVAAAVFIILNFSVSRNLRKNYFAGKDKILDLVLSPVPANPICWFAIQVGVNSDTYIVKRGMISVLPELLRADKCPNLGRIGSQSGQFEQTGITEAHWSESYSVPFSELDILENDCHLRAWMRLVRVPYFMEGKVTDLRFSRGGFANFTDLGLNGEICPPNIPPWVPPRMDLLELAGKAHLF